MQKRAINKRRLSSLLIAKLRPQARPFLTWDTDAKGLGLKVQPSGHKTFVLVYRFGGRPRWLHLGDAAVLPLSDARMMAAERMLAVVRDGKDPAGEKRQGRGVSKTFAHLADRHLNEYAKKRNKSWRQADALIRRYAIPLWGQRDAATISRSDARALIGSIDAPILGNQVLASVSAVFAWATRQELLTLNPCRNVERNETTARERILSDSEVLKFWQAFCEAGLPGTALKMILLTGQRPGEVAHMRREHIKDRWWELPGSPVPALGWLGTKNGANHRLWIAAPVQALLDEVGDEASTGFVFASSRGRAITKLDAVMRAISTKLAVEAVRPHDLRRTFCSKVTELGFGRPAMDRIANHVDGGVGSIYDRYSYSEENKKIMEATAARIMQLVEGTATTNVVPFAATLR